MNIIDLQRFYLSPQGQEAAKYIKQKLANLCPRLASQTPPDKCAKTLLAIGYTSPFVNPKNSDFNPLISLMPDYLGGEYQLNRNQQNITCIAREKNLPFGDNSIDYVLIMHVLEFSRNPEACIAEAWRVLNHDGKLLLAVPARRGLWARRENTPLGHGHPFSERQMRQLLVLQGFGKIKCARALYWPPQSGKFSPRLARLSETILPYIVTHSGGILLFYAEKSLTNRRHPKPVRVPRIFIPDIAPEAAKIAHNRQP